MNIRGRANYGEMGYAGCVPIGLRDVRTFKKYLFEYGLDITTVNGYEVSNYEYGYYMVTE